MEELVRIMLMLKLISLAHAFGSREIHRRDPLADATNSAAITLRQLRFGEDGEKETDRNSER